MQFRDLKAQYDALKPDIDSAINSVLNSSEFILGKQVTELENILAEYVGRKHCISCASGTDALQLSLMALNVRQNDAVFTSDFTYFASAGTSSVLGATPVFADIDERTFNISPDALEMSVQRVLSEGKLNPKAIIPVDLFGLPADYSKIIPIAEKYNLRILEDGAQGFGGSIDGKMACSFGDISITSFFPAKPLGCYGDGGAIFTDDDALDTKLRSLRSQGRSLTNKFDTEEIGINSRLDTIQAAVLIPKFRAFVDYESDAVNRTAEQYTERLADKVITPFVPDAYYSSWAQYTIKLRDANTRNRVQRVLKENGIPSMIYYPRGLHQQKAYESMKLPDERYPNTVKATETVLSLPIHPYLKTEDIDRITKVITHSL